MTKKECAIIMAHTGVCMLAGKDFKIFHKYVEDILGRPVYVDEMAYDIIEKEIKEGSKEDFLELCRNAESIKVDKQTMWIPVSERLPKIAEEVLVTYSFNSSNGKIRYVEIAERYGNESNVYWISRTDEYKLDPSKHKVVAWMPLPNSYKEEE